MLRVDLVCSTPPLHGTTVATCKASETHSPLLLAHMLRSSRHSAYPVVHRRCIRFFIGARSYAVSEEVTGGTPPRSYAARGLAVACLSRKWLQMQRLRSSRQEYNCSSYRWLLVPAQSQAHRQAAKGTHRPCEHMLRWTGIERQLPLLHLHRVVARLCACNGLVACAYTHSLIARPHMRTSAVALAGCAGPLVANKDAPDALRTRGLVHSPYRVPTKGMSDKPAALPVGCSVPQCVS